MWQIRTELEGERGRDTVEGREVEFNQTNREEKKRKERRREEKRREEKKLSKEKSNCNNLIKIKQMRWIHNWRETYLIWYDK